MSNPAVEGPQAVDPNLDDVIPDDDPEVANYPPMATGNNCAKNWDVALLQNCTGDRMKVIAAALDVPVTTRVRKYILYRAIYNFMSNDQSCPSCEGGDCAPNSHMFAPTEQPPPGWVMGDNGLYVEPIPAPASTSAPVTLPISTPASAPSSGQQQLITTHTLASGQQHVILGQFQTAGTSQQQVRPLLTNTTGSLSSTLVHTRIRGPTPNSSLHRPTGSFDVLVSSAASPAVSGVVQPRPTAPDVANLVIQGAAATGTFHTLSHSGTLSIPETPEIIALRAQLDAEDQQIALQQQQEFLTLQQQAQSTSQQALAALRQEREQARQQQLLAHQQRCQQYRPTVPSPLAQPHVAPTQAVPIPAAPRTAFVFGNGSSNPSAPGQFSAPAQSNLVGHPHYASTGSLPTSNPGINVQPASPLAGMDHAQFLALIDQRIQSQNMLSPPVANLQGCALGGSAPQLCGDKSGKPLAHSIENSEQAARLGIHASPVFEVQGDLVGVDMSKLRKVMTPGDDQVGAGLVFRQIRWPHKMLQPEVPGFDTTAHKDLTFHQLMNGMLSKILTETPAARLDKELSNKLAFTQFLVTMSFHYSHKQVLDTCHEMMMGWMMREFEWDNWPLIESRLKNIRSRFTQVPQQHTYSNRREHKHNPGGPPNNQPGKQQQGKQDVNGVPKVFMRENQICINFNDKACPEKGSHDNKYKAGQSLKHICAGCYKKLDKAELGHPTAGCGQGPFGSLFRQK